MVMKKRFLIIALLPLLLLAPAGPSSAGMVSLTFDDGLAGTYAYGFQVLKKYDMHGTVGLIYQRLMSGNDDYMTPAQALDLQKHGWEIASHSYTHKRPFDIPEYYSSEQIKGWGWDDDKKKTYQADYEYAQISCLMESGKQLREADTLDQMEKTAGSFYFDRVIEALHVRPFKAKEPAKLDISSCSYEREMEESRKALEKHGLHVQTYITPYNSWTDELKPVGRKYYKYIVTGSDTFNRRESFDPAWITRIVVSTNDTVNGLMRQIKDKAVQQDGWVVFCMHDVGRNVGWEPWDAERLERLCAWLQQEKIPVVTISEGAALMMGQAPAVKKAP